MVISNCASGKGRTEYDNDQFHELKQIKFYKNIVIQPKYTKSLKLNKIL